jgi:AraC-like DNA-binding protein
MAKMTVEIDVPDSLLEPVFRALATRAGRLTKVEAARLVHLSPSGFSRLFRRTCGVSFRAARLEAKLMTATALLSHTSMRVSEIAFSVGYSRLNRFERAFKKRHGLTPTLYRRSLRSRSEAATAP